MNLRNDTKMVKLDFPKSQFLHIYQHCFGTKTTQSFSVQANHQILFTLYLTIFIQF